jgi:hypothetical protein
MFIGHFAVGFGAKKYAPRTSLALLLTAPLLSDLLWPWFLLSGWERMCIDPGNTRFVPGPGIFSVVAQFAEVRGLGHGVCPDLSTPRALRARNRDHLARSVEPLGSGLGYAPPRHADLSRQPALRPRAIQLRRGHNGGRDYLARWGCLVVHERNKARRPQRAVRFCHLCRLASGPVRRRLLRPAAQWHLRPRLEQHPV